MGNSEDKIAMATRHVDDGRRIVAKQRDLVASGRGGPDAVRTLKNFEKSLEIFEGDLDRLLREQVRT